jgi:hypothetical protein
MGRSIDQSQSLSSSVLTQQEVTERWAGRRLRCELREKTRNWLQYGYVLLDWTIQ